MLRRASQVAPVPREPGEYRCLQKAAVTELLDFDPADPRVVHTCMKGDHVEMVTDHPSASPLVLLLKSHDRSLRTSELIWSIGLGCSRASRRPKRGRSGARSTKDGYARP